MSDPTDHEQEVGTSRTLVLTLDRGDAGVRVDRVLLRHLHHRAGVSRTRIQALIESGRVEVNGRPVVRVAQRVAAGDRLVITLPATALREPMQAEPAPLQVLFEDDYLLAVDKPAGLVVHPTYKHTSGTLIQAIVARAPRAGLVHRLDKLTSGIVLAAKDPATHAAMQRALQRRAVDKIYLAVVVGRPSPRRGTIAAPLGRDPFDRRRVIVDDAHGAPSVTHYERLADAAPVSLVRCTLVTGRMHQIRVHLASRGWPLVGDPRYGPPTPPAFGDPSVAASVTGFTRQALHAWRLSFTHPVTGAVVALEAALPADMQALITAIGLERAWRETRRRDEAEGDGDAPR